MMARCVWDDLRDGEFAAVSARAPVVGRHVDVDPGGRTALSSPLYSHTMPSVPRQLYLPVPVASFRNVTETLAPGVPPLTGVCIDTVDLEGKWLSGTFSVLNRQVGKGIVAS